MACKYPERECGIDPFSSAVPTVPSAKNVQRKIMVRAFGARELSSPSLIRAAKFGSLEECIEALATQSKAGGGLLVPVFCGLVSADLAERLSACDAPFEVQLDFQTWSSHLAKRLLLAWWTITRSA